MSSYLSLNKKQLKDAFDLLDYKKDGELDIQEILQNMEKLGYQNSHPELYDLIESLGDNKVNYSDFVTIISEVMNQKEDDAGLQRMYDTLLFNTKLQTIDYDTLKKISDETGNYLTDMEIRYALREVGDGKTIPIESFIKYMKSK